MAALASDTSTLFTRAAPMAYAISAAGAVGAGLYYRGPLLAAVLLLVIGICTALVGRVSLRQAGVLATCGAAFTIPWNAVVILWVRPGDLLLLVALMFFVAGSGLRNWPLPPWWVLQLAAVIAVLAGIHEAVPAGQEFVRQHTFYTPTGQAITATPSNLGSPAAGWSRLSA